MSQVPGLFVPQQKQNKLSSSQYQDPVYGSPSTFSFSEAVGQLILPFLSPGKKLPVSIPLAGIQLVSVSTHKDPFPVVSLGHTGIKGYTEGHRTTAGTLAFTVLGEEPFAEALRAYSLWRGNSRPIEWVSPDDLPPFNLSLSFVNEFGNSIILQLRSVKIVDTARNISIRDIQLSHVYSFLASRCSTLVLGDRLGVGAHIPDQQPKPIPPSNNAVWNQTYTPFVTFTTTSESSSTSVSSTTTSESSTTVTTYFTDTTGTTLTTATG